MKIKNENSIKDLLIFDAHCDTANALLDNSSYFIKEKQNHLDDNKIKKRLIDENLDFSDLLQSDLILTAKKIAFLIIIMKRGNTLLTRRFHHW